MKPPSDSTTPAPLPPPRSPGPIARLGARYPRLRRGLLAAADALILLLGFWLAYEVRFDFHDSLTGLNRDYGRQFLFVAPALILLRMAMLHLLGLYRGFTRYTGIYEIVNIALACAAGSLALVVFNVLTHYLPPLGPYPVDYAGLHLLRVPWGVVVIDAVFSAFALAGFRMVRRLAGELLLERQGEGARRVMIVGQGDAAEQVVRELRRGARDRYRPVVVVDPDPAMHGMRIHGLRVEAPLERLPDVMRRYRVEMVLIALRRPAPALLRQIVEHCRRARLEFKIVPHLEALMTGSVQVSELRPVEIEDLLGRPPVVVAPDPAQSCLAGRRVLVTGAGGSIGAELCRQALEHRPAALHLLGRGENSLYDIEHRLAPRAAELGIPLQIIIGDVRDRPLIDGLFGHIRPQVVLHAAAHKHVHFMELQPAEAIKNNVAGTRVVAEAARAVAAERFILISTDKAVRPAGIMGASKRIAEMTVSALNAAGPTRYIAVRFGNVLGSRGSVIPLFRRQIAAGGPVTVTHPEATRYFMTIPEAVSLVIEAGSVGSGGEVFLLDMGDPVRIIDLARNLITLSGLEPEVDIPIKITGMRPGEKMFEELLTSEQFRQPTGHEKIYRCAQPDMSWEALRPKLDELEGLAAAGDEDGIRSLLADLIPDYQASPPRIRP